MHSTFRTLAALLAVVTLSACGASVSNGSDPAGGTPSQSLPEDPAEASLSVNDSYRLYRQVTVSNDRTLTLIAHGEKLDASSFGISSIEVMDGDTLLQTISIHDGIAAGNAYDGVDDPQAEDTTRSFEETSGLDIRDYNFDDFLDLAITELWGTANERRLLWIWDDTSGAYTFALPLVGTEIQLDTENQTVITCARDGAADVVTTTYAPAGGGQLQKIQETVETYASDTKTETVTHALIDGEWVLVDGNE